jgi:splicing factor 3B subunit 3
VLTAIENIHCLLELQDNEVAFSVCTVNFHDREHGIILAFGTAKGLVLAQKTLIYWVHSHL